MQIESSYFTDEILTQSGIYMYITGKQDTLSNEYYHVDLII